MGQTHLLLLHGALGSQTQFDPLMPLVAGLGQVHRLHFEGHGTAPRLDRPFQIEHFAQNVLDYLDAHNIDQAHFFGYSMGGYVAVYLALTWPARTAAVFTLATKFHWTPEVAAKETALMDADKILAKVPRFAESLEQQHGPDWKVLLGKTSALLTDLGENNRLNPEALAAVGQRVRVGVGDRDSMVSIDESLGVYRTLQQGEFQVLPNTPHPLDRVSPELLAQALRTFLV